jgi:hypothetical protein
MFTLHVTNQRQVPASNPSQKFHYKYLYQQTNSIHVKTIQKLYGQIMNSES